MKSIEESLKEYARGLTGGLLFSLPMLYTMEMWWAGFLLSPFRLVVYFIIGFGILMIYNYFVGIRESYTVLGGLSESVEEMGIALFLTVFILWITHRIAPGMSVDEIAGKTIVEAVTVAIGISVGKTQLGRRAEDEEVGNNKDPDRSLFRGVGVSLCGALLVSSNIAPTEEVLVIALNAPVYKIILIALLSMALAGIILYSSNFKGSEVVIASPSRFDIFFGTTLTYTVALISSAFLLWFFNRFEGLALYGIVAETVTLSFPCALGASAGRLLIQS